MVDIDSREIFFQHSLDYRKDEHLKKYGTQGQDYILPPKSAGEANQPPRMFFAALEAMFADMKFAGLPMRDIIVCNTSTQQHSHAYMGRHARTIFARLNIPGNSEARLTAILEGSLALNLIPTWMTSAAEEAKAIRDFIGGREKMVQMSGSDSPARFTGAVIRKIARQYPAAYQETEHLHLLSSLIPAVLTGNSRTPMDFGNACGMSMMDYSSKDWSVKLIKAVANELPGGESALRNKLLPIVSPYTIVGRIATFFIEKYGFSPDCRIIAGSGDNPQSKVLITDDLLSLGTSFVNMVSTDGKKLDMNGYSNGMYDGTGRPFIFGCRTNGALVWDQLRAVYGMKKDEYEPAEKALSTTPLGKNIVFWQPRDESFPASGRYEMIRMTHNKPSLGNDYSGLVESTLATIYLYSKPFAKESAGPLYITGGASRSPEIVRRIAAIWNRPVVSMEQTGAASGAAMSGIYAFLRSTGKEVKIEEITRNLLRNSVLVNPRPEDVRAYHEAGGYLGKFIPIENEITKAHPLASRQ
ncbi:MAG: hypothetical protein JW856_04960 [Dehalococcoidales bacterium]|nr:hypothetical protein [Dehalococcoidales bacterium]